VEPGQGGDPVTLADERASQQGTQTSAYTTAPPLDSTRSAFTLWGDNGRTKGVAGLLQPPPVASYAV
jgi:hypothetical protein